MRRVVIAGAAGRDFHNFNVVFRGRDEVEVVAFTATQIPHIDDRRYPAELAGDRYPDGIPIVPEEELPDLVARDQVDEVVFAYSDVTHEHVMHIGSIALAAGADFRLLGPALDRARLRLSGRRRLRRAHRLGQEPDDAPRRRRPARCRARASRCSGIRCRTATLREQAVQRFETFDDIDASDCTIEEREEYEPHVAEGNLVFAGIDYAAILSKAEKEADVIVWDGGNNDTPFIAPDFHIVVCDPHRPGHELALPPGRDQPAHGGCLRHQQDRHRATRGSRGRAQLDPQGQSGRQDRARRLAVHRRGRSRGDSGQARAGRRGRPDADARGDELRGVLAAKQYGADSLVDPRPFAVGSIRKTFETYRHLSGSSCPRWATAGSRWRSCARRSRARTQSSSSSERRSTSAGSSTSTSRRCA